MEDYVDNQIQENQEEQEDFAQETREVTESTDENQSSEELSQAEKDFLEIQYNKEVIKLDKDKAKEYAQKGMNYDKVKSRLEALESDPRLTFVEKQAQKYGMTIDEYLRAVEQEEQEQEIQRLAESKGLPEDIAKELYESKKFREQYTQREQQELAQKNQQKMLADFINEYPDVKADDIPQEVWKDFDRGIDLVSAYAKYENKVLKEKLRNVSNATRINQDNAEASTGSVTGQGNGNFVSFTKEQVQNMTTEEVNKNYNNILKSMKSW